MPKDKLMHAITVLSCTIKDAPAIQCDLHLEAIYTLWELFAHRREHFLSETVLPPRVSIRQSKEDIPINPLIPRDQSNKMVFNTWAPANPSTAWQQPPHSKYNLPTQPILKGIPRYTTSKDRQPQDIQGWTTPYYFQGCDAATNFPLHLLQDGNIYSTIYPNKWANSNVHAFTLGKYLFNCSPSCQPHVPKRTIAAWAHPMLDTEIG